MCLTLACYVMFFGVILNLQAQNGKKMKEALVLRLMNKWWKNFATKMKLILYVEGISWLMMVMSSLRIESL